MDSVFHDKLIVQYLYMETQDPNLQPPDSIPTNANTVKNTKTPPITLISVSTFILLALSTIIFLYNQNRELKKIVATYQQTPSPTPVAISTPTPNPSKPIVTSPLPNSKVTSPLKVTGTVPSGWMFEGVSIIKLVDEKNKLIVQGQAKEVVPGSWTSGEPIAFGATLTFKTTAKSGFLILQNDNPSGIPEKSILFTVPVSFTDTDEAKYVCPANGYVDCMPGPGGVKYECTPEAMDWYTKNCPDFKGGAY